MLLRKILWITFFITLIMVVMAFVVHYFLFTTDGSKALTEFLLNRYLEAEKIHIGSVKGNLAETITFENVMIENPEALPFPGVLKINRLNFSFRAYAIQAIDVEVFNARVNMPGLDVLMINGSYRQGNLDVNVYARNIDVNAVLKMVNPGQSFPQVSGYVRRLDIDVTGPLRKLQLRGPFFIERLNHQRFSLIKSRGRLDLNFMNLRRNFNMQGYVMLENGTVSGPRTAVINLEESRILFDGNPEKPMLDIRGLSRVERVDIEIGVRGTVNNPRINLASNPSLPKERLLLMLATNQGWTGFDTVLEQGQIPPSLAKDFIDYFFFSGSSNRLADYFGIDDFSVTLEEGRRGVGIEKTFTDHIRGTYRLEQTDSGQSSDLKQRIGGQYRITESISIEAEKELRREDHKSLDSTPPDDRLLFKFQKQF